MAVAPLGNSRSLGFHLVGETKLAQDFRDVLSGSGSFGVRPKERIAGAQCIANEAKGALQKADRVVAALTVAAKVE